MANCLSCTAPVVPPLGIWCMLCKFTLIGLCGSWLHPHTYFACVNRMWSLIWTASISWWSWSPLPQESCCTFKYPFSYFPLCSHCREVSAQWGWGGYHGPRHSKSDRPNSVDLVKIVKNTCKDFGHCLVDIHGYGDYCQVFVSSSGISERWNFKNFHAVCGSLVF